MGNYYFCKLIYKLFNMKKVVFAVVVCLSLILGACKHETVTTKYTIGCLGYQYGSMEESDWKAIENYFSENVDFNKNVEFEGESLAENDVQAKNYYNEQIAKIDPEYVSSMLKGSDFYVYGISTLNADGSYRNIAAMKFTAGGASDFTK